MHLWYVLAFINKPFFHELKYIAYLTFTPLQEPSGLSSQAQVEN
jgi:hypothetical protein